MNNYKISIIIPVYNSVKYLRDTFNSVKNQSFNFEDLEIIFINDKSTDGSLDILKGYNEKYNNVFLYTSPKDKRGSGVSRNLGISKATSDYIIFLDSDDIMHPKYIETVYSEITKNNVDLVKTSFCVNSEEITFPVTQNLGRVEVFHDDVSVLIDFNYLEPWCTIYRTNYLIEENIRFIEKFNIHESFLFAIETIVKAKNGIILLDNFQGQTWRLRKDGLHNKTIAECDLEYTMDCIIKMLLFVVTHQPVNCIEKFARFILSLWAFDLITSKEKKEIINAFIFEKGFKLDADTINEAFS